VTGDPIRLELESLRRVQAALRELAGAVSVGRGDEFFRDFAALIGRTLSADLVLISVLSPDGGRRLQPLAAWSAGLPVEFGAYDLAGTPCEKVVDSGPCVFPDNVQTLFPRDTMLGEFGAEAYVGAPLLDARGGLAGNIAALYRRPIEDSGLAADLMRICAARVGGELERLEALKAAEEERGFLEMQVRQAQKLEAIGTLAGGVAHDFNNVLAGILGNIEVAALKLPPGHPVQPHFDEVLKAVRRARNLVAQLLTFSRRSEGQREPTSLPAVLDEALELLRPGISRQIELRVHVEPELPPIVADGTQIHQLFMNLGTNAAYALRDSGGVLEFRLEMAPTEEGTAEAHSDLARREVRIVVRDTGPGMDAAVRERIFEPFFTTKPPGEGTGLGLSVVHGIVESHGGGIHVTSAPGEGTTFDIRLPVASGEAPEVGEAAPPPRLGQGRCALLVDDEAAVGIAARHVLDHLGFDVVLHRNPLHAFEEFRAGPDRFALLVTDLSMPERTGVELVRDVRRHRPDLPVVLMTGFARGAETQAALGFPRLAILEKPFSLAALARTLGELLEEPA
jgi:signal transduction histidine kinase/CheY-like chemotaxis protein